MVRIQQVRSVPVQTHSVDFMAASATRRSHLLSYNPTKLWPDRVPTLGNVQGVGVKSSILITYSTLK